MTPTLMVHPFALSPSLSLLSFNRFDLLICSNVIHFCKDCKTVSGYFKTIESETYGWMFQEQKPNILFVSNLFSITSLWEQTRGKRHKEKHLHSFFSIFFYVHLFISFMCHEWYWLREVIHWKHQPNFPFGWVQLKTISYSNQ